MANKKKGGVSGGNGGNPMAGFILMGKWLLVLLVLIACSIFAAHHIYQFMGPKYRRNGELVSAGYYGQKIHVHCLHASEEDNSTIFVIHHDNHMTCMNYAKLQKGLLEQGYSSCCVERPGFGLSPLPHSISESVSLKGEAALLVEAVLYSAGDEHKFISVGHGAGGVFAWACNKLPQTAHMHAGLIMLDGMTPWAFRDCPEVARLYRASPISLQEQILQQSGLRRLMAYFDASTDMLKLPADATEEEIKLQRHFMLSDKMFTASNRAFGKTKRMANQLVGLTVSKTIPAVYLVSNSGISKKEGYPFMECFNDAGAKLIQKQFVKSKVMPVRNVGHLSLLSAVDEMVEAAKFVVGESK